MSSSSSSSSSSTSNNGSSSSSSSSTSSSSGTSRLFIGNLHPSTSEGDLILVMKAYGTILSVNYIWNKITGTPRGFAFIEYATNAEAQKAIRSANGTIVRGRRLVVRHDNARSTEPSSSNGVGGKKRMYDDGPMTTSGGGGDPSKKTKSLRNIDDEIRRLQEALSSEEPNKRK